jgi:sugar lactone lactonase YvrE/tetratricopeptide (TPR) repeat protein
MGKRLALIVGNSVYQDQTLVRLKAPDVDVGSLHEVLKDPEVGGFEFVDLLINSKSSIVRRAISEFYSRKTRDDLLLLYFSGHGVLDERGRLYLAVKDTDHGLLSGTAVSASFIADEMDNSRSQRQVLILDCCHSGAFARGTKGSPGLTVGTATAFEGTGFGRVVLTATDATQYAWEGERVIGDAENSLFTHYLVRGLQSGEADANRDGQITIDELYDYVYAHVVQQSPKQTPGKWSFKEQGEIIIARAGQAARMHPAITVKPFVDVELQQKLEQLYTKGLSAYWLEEWEQAAYNFQLILEIDPDYQDATEKFADVRRQLDLKNTYNKALEAFESQKYLEAVTVFERLVAEAPDYKDAAAKLQVARKQSQIADLYSQAKQLHQAQEWQAVLQVFEKIAELAPDYTDPEELLPHAKREYDAQKRREDIQERYRQALRAMNSEKWQEARDGFAGIQEMEPGFEETERLLARVEAEISRREAQKQLQERLGVLYGQAVGYSRDKQWQQALEKIVEIESLDPGFSDPHGIAGRVRAEMRRLEQEAERQNALAALYAEAVRLLRTGQYPEALEKWGEVQASQPDYPDRQGVQKNARKMLAAQEKLRAGKPRLSLRMVVIPVLLVLALLVAVLNPFKTVVVFERTFGETGVPYFIDTDHIYYPEGVAVDSAGNVWVAETFGGRALKYTGDGSFLMSIGVAGSNWVDQTHFCQSSDIAEDGSGNVWVADRCAARVVQYNASGVFLKELGVNGEVGFDNEHFAFPVGVAVDSTGRIYVSDEFNHRVQVFGSSGVYSATIGETGVPGEDNAHFQNPYRIAVDVDDNLYVADQENHRVQIFNKEHNYVATMGVTSQRGSENDELDFPRGVAVDTDNIYIADGNYRVQIYDRTSRAYMATLGGRQGSGNDEFNWPIDVAVDATGNLYVSDAENHRIQKFDSNLAYVLTIGTTGVPYPTDDKRYNEPICIDVGPDGDIGIVEKTNKGYRFILLDAGGELLASGVEVDEAFNDNQHLGRPVGAAFSSDGKIYIADAGNGQIQIINANGGSWIGKIDVDKNGNYYIINQLHHTVQIYDSSYTYLASLGVTGEPGSDNTHFSYPTAITIDARGNIYIADTGNHRVQIYDSSYTYLATLGVTGEPGSDNTHFSSPRDVTVDARGNIYIADQDNHRIQKFNSNRVYETTLGTTGECGGSITHLCNPFSVAVDGQGRIFVADSDNARIQVFSPTRAYLTWFGGD